MHVTIFDPPTVNRNNAFLIRDMENFIRAKLMELSGQRWDQIFDFVHLISNPKSKYRVCAQVPCWHPKIITLSKPMM